MFSPDDAQSPVNERPKIKFRSGKPRVRCLPVEWDDSKIREKCHEGTAAMRAAYEASSELEAMALKQELELALKRNQELRDVLDALNFDSEAFRPVRLGMEIAKKHGVTWLDIKSRRVARHISRARQEWFWVMRKETALSLPAIARICGGRDHTTVIHGVRAHAKRLEGPDAVSEPTGARAKDAPAGEPRQGGPSLTTIVKVVPPHPSRDASQ